jgi:tetratricopeptide (TPR) repeat protein
MPFQSEWLIANSRRGDVLVFLALRTIIEHYRKALQIDSHLAGVHYELSEAIIEASPSNPDSLSEAEKELETAIANEGDSANIEAELGRIAYARSDLPQALSHYTKAYGLNPGNVDAQLGLARVLAAQEKPQEAVKYLREAVAADPLNGEAHYRLALVYRTLKLPDDAKREVTLYEEIKKTKDQVKQLYRQMNRQPKPEVGEPSSAPN